MKVPIPARPKFKLGQNFLRDQNVLEKIVDFFQPAKDDSVLEIGAGTGALTTRIAPGVKRMIAVELDPDLLPFLETIPGVEIIWSDIRKLDLCLLSATAPLRIIGNLPYYISSSILSYLIRQRSCLVDLTLMFQKEVAQRITAPPSSHEYGFLSVVSQYYCSIKKGFRISRNSFVPRPEIESQMLHFTFNSKTRFSYEEYSSFVALAFSHRRKKLRNNLLAALSLHGEQLDDAFQRLNLAETVRAENLSAIQFEQLILLLRNIETSSGDFPSL